ncbi:protein of unknown function [Shewanella benthica]|uniref:Uncharacterized protein n=1 Tax=Shewanella benthica TaxID=43661 RepID=A0A330ME31_9GAMM|nr:protein of unknown function [Shewanella benthica]
MTTILISLTFIEIVTCNRGDSKCTVFNQYLYKHNLKYDHVLCNSLFFYSLSENENRLRK